MANPKSILVFTASHLCRNPRVVKEASTLGAAGYDVTVLTTSVSDRFERMDLDLIRGLPFRRLALDYRSSSGRRALYAWGHRAWTRIARTLVAETGLQFASALGPASDLLRAARQARADLTIAHTEIPTWAAAHLAHEGRRIAVDIEDWYSEDLLHADRRGRPVRLLREAEAFTLRHAAYSCATSQSMADALVRAFSCKPPVVLRNVFPLQRSSRVDAPASTSEPRLIWFSQTVGPGRGIELLLSAWARTTQRSRIYLLGDERPGYCEHLRNRLPETHRERLHFLPIVTPEQLPPKLAEFDLGLALEPRLPLNRNITTTNKLFQYFNAGLGVIASDTAGQREILEAAPDTGLLVPLHETTQLAAELDALFGDPDRIRRMQIAAREAATRHYCWEREAPKLLAAVESAFHESRQSC